MSFRHPRKRRDYNDWYCPVCEENVWASKSRCDKCKTPKLKKGDWVCRRAPCAHTFNFAARAACITCHVAKPVACVCAAPQFTNLTWGDAYERLGDCRRCLLANPGVWYMTVLDRKEEKMRAEGVTSEQWRYEIQSDDREVYNTLGLGVQVGIYSAWVFRTRADVVAELALHTDHPTIKVY